MDPMMPRALKCVSKGVFNQQASAPDPALEPEDRSGIALTTLRVLRYCPAI
jgi:hypothetical protein